MRNGIQRAVLQRSALDRCVLRINRINIDGQRARTHLTEPKVGSIGSQRVIKLACPGQIAIVAEREVAAQSNNRCAVVPGEPVAISYTKCLASVNSQRTAPRVADTAEENRAIIGRENVARATQGAIDVERPGTPWMEFQSSRPYSQTTVLMECGGGGEADATIIHIDVVRVDTRRNRTESIAVQTNQSPVSDNSATGVAVVVQGYATGPAINNKLTIPIAILNHNSLCTVQVVKQQAAIAGNSHLLSAPREAVGAIRRCDFPAIGQGVDPGADPDSGTAAQIKVKSRRC